MKNRREKREILANFFVSFLAKVLKPLLFGPSFLSHAWDSFFLPIKQEWEVSPSQKRVGEKRVEGKEREA